MNTVRMVLNLGNSVVMKTEWLYWFMSQHPPMRGLYVSWDPIVATICHQVNGDVLFRKTDE